MIFMMPMGLETHRLFRYGLLGNGPLGRDSSVKGCCFHNAVYFEIVISVGSPMIQQ